MASRVGVKKWATVEVEPVKPASPANTSAPPPPGAAPTAKRWATVEVTDKPQKQEVSEGDGDEFVPKLISLAMNGSLAKADELIAKNKGADLDAAYIKVFFKAIRENHPAVINWLFAKGVDPNSKEFGSTALHLIAGTLGNDTKKQLALIKKLASTGKINPNLKDSSGQTPLHLAALCSWGEATEVTKALLQLPEIDTSILDNSGKTAYQHAVRKERHGTMAAIDEHQRTNKPGIIPKSASSAAASGSAGSAGTRDVAALEAKVETLTKLVLLLAKELEGTSLISRLGDLREFIHELERA